MLITYSEFCKKLANQFHARSSIQNIYHFEFDNLKSKEQNDEYEVNFWLKDQYKTQLTNKIRPFISDTSILSWCQQISKVLLNKIHPETEKSHFFITDQRIICKEPCFEDLPIHSNIRVLSQREEQNKYDFSLLYELGKNQMSVRIDITALKYDDQLIENYYQRHVALYAS